MEIDLARQLCRGVVTLKWRQQTLRATLIELEGTLSQLIGHCQCQIRCTHTHRLVGCLLLSFGDDAIPILDTHEIVVFHQLILLRIEAVMLRNEQKSSYSKD